MNAPKDLDKQFPADPGDRQADPDEPDAGPADEHGFEDDWQYDAGTD